jgi:hypothetical protein
MLSARERLSFISDIASLMGEKEDTIDYREELAKQAFADDKVVLAKYLMDLRT